jgi:hypothetical protein
MSMTSLSNLVQKNLLEQARGFVALAGFPEGQLSREEEEVVQCR